MKKFLAVCVIGLALATGSVFADHPSGWGVGIVGGGGLGGFGGGLSLKAPSLPIYWVINARAGNEGLALAATGDYYFIDDVLVPDINLGWYFGVGGHASLWGFNDKLGLAAGVRVPIGLSWQFLGHGEIFLEVAPQVGVQILPSFGLDTDFFNGALGFRFWF
ncbi:MAG: hypothetical protein LBG05_08075 [Treponema sp.]|nr:hypothetical protein [Treponema sp.]